VADRKTIAATLAAAIISAKGFPPNHDDFGAGVLAGVGLRRGAASGSRRRGASLREGL
jgi:hypothetical protein